MRLLFPPTVPLLLLFSGSLAKPLLLHHSLRQNAPLARLSTRDVPGPPPSTSPQLAHALNLSLTDLHAFSVFYAWEVQAAAQRDALVAERLLNRSIDDEVHLCWDALVGDCRPLVDNGHRREGSPMWARQRKEGERVFDIRMEWVFTGGKVARRWAGRLEEMMKVWKGERGRREGWVGGGDGKGDLGG